MASSSHIRLVKKQAEHEFVCDNCGMKGYKTYSMCIRNMTQDDSVCQKCRKKGDKCRCNLRKLHVCCAIAARCTVEGVEDDIARTPCYIRHDINDITEEATKNNMKCLPAELCNKDLKGYAVRVHVQCKQGDYRHPCCAHKWYNHDKCLCWNPTPQRNEWNKATTVPPQRY